MNVWVVVKNYNDSCHCHPEWQVSVSKVFASEEAANAHRKILDAEYHTHASVEGPFEVEGPIEIEEKE